MFCINCGKDIADDAVTCEWCESPVQPVNEIESSIANDVSWSAAEMFGLVVASILIPLIGIIFGIVHINSVAKKQQSKTLLIVSITTIAVVIIGTIAIFTYFTGHFFTPMHPAPVAPSPVITS